MFISIIGMPGSIIALIVISILLIAGNIAFGAYAYKQKKKGVAETQQLAEKTKQEEPVVVEELIVEEPVENQQEVSSEDEIVEISVNSDEDAKIE